MIIVILIIVAATLAYNYLRWNFTHWQRRGIPCTKPNIPFGSLGSVVRKERSFSLAIYDVYTATKERIYGIYLMLRPALLVRDAQLARDVLAKDFQSFHDRGLYVDEKNDPMSASLFFLEGHKWKALRTKLTPSFTSGKLKAMFGTADSIADKMLKHLKSVVVSEDKGSTEIEMKTLLKTYAIDIIGSVIFGLDVDSFADPNNEFHKLSLSLNEPTLISSIRGTAQFLYPVLEKIFLRLLGKQEGPERMRKLVLQTVEYREQHGIVRRDMLQLLLQLRNTGKINADDNVWTAETTADAIKSMSVDSIAAQLFLFYVAGYETTASTAAFTLYEFMQYPEILAKAQNEVTEVLAKHGVFTYDAVQDMKYLDLCIMETTRKYPALAILNRVCTQEYPIPGTNKVIEKGTPIIISLLGIHRDEEYFPDALRYDPDRFLPEVMNYNPVAYMPFGEGPRHCIAQRMGKVNVKIALAKILSNFNIETRTERREIEFDNYGIPLIPKGGIPVRLSKRKSLV